MAYPTSTVNVITEETSSDDVISGNFSTDDVITRESIAETEPCSRQRMVVCYSAVDERSNADIGALVPNLTNPSLDRLCRYASSSSNSKK